MGLRNSLGTLRGSSVLGRPGRGRWIIVLSAVVAAAVLPEAVGAASPTSPPSAPPPNGTGSVSRIPLGSAGETATACVARALDGAVWILESGRRYQLVRVGPDGAVSAFPLPGSGAPSGASTQCLTVAGDGAVWVANTDPSAVLRFDPQARTLKRLVTPTANGGPADVAAAPDGAVWFDERAAHRICRIDSSGRITEYRLPSALTYGPYTLTATPDSHVWVGATGLITTDPATHTQREPSP